MTKLEEYNEIMRRYRRGDFGKRHLYLNELFEAAGSPNLLYEMTMDELDYLINRSSGLNKIVFSRIKEERQNETIKLELK